MKAIVLSRVIAEKGYIGHWIRVADQHQGDPLYASADTIVRVPKFVLSDKLQQTRWDRTEVLAGDLPAEVSRLKSAILGPIGVFGGTGFASALIAQGLADELHLYINPVALGAGEHLFDLRGRTALTLIDATPYP